MRHVFLFSALALCPLLRAQTDLYDLDTLRDFHVTFQQSDWWNQLARNYSSGTNIRADLKVDGKTYKDVGVRIRGNTSYTWNRGTQKIPLNIRTDAFVPNQEVLGYKNLNLQNAYKDATFVREPIAYLLMRRHLPSLQANWIKLWLNGTYWGVYVSIQQPNKTYLRDWFDEEDGNLYRGDSPTRRTRPTLTYLGNDPRSYASQYDHKTDDHPRPWIDLIALCKTVDTDPLAQLPQTLPRVLNVDRALWYLALQNILSNTDSYIGTGNDYLVFNDELHNRFQMMPWDLNTAFGGYDWPGQRLGAQGLKRMDPFYDGGTSLRRPLERTWQIPQWRERYLAHFRTMLDDWFSWSVVGPIATKYHKMLEPHVKADTKKLYTTQQFYDNLTKDIVVRDCCGSYTIPGLQSFMDTKRAFLLSYAAINRTAPTLADLKHTPPKPKVTDRVFVTAKVGGPGGNVTLFWRVQGPFLEAPMFDDGKHGDGAANDGVFGAIIPPQNAGLLVQYYVKAAAGTTATAAVTFAPRRTTHALHDYRIEHPRGTSAIQINELLAKNVAGIKDEKGEHEDWVELVNVSNQIVDIGGMFVSDKLANPQKWTIPAGTKIAAGGTLLLWADEDPLDGPLHMNFKLTAAGEDVLLFDKDGKTQVDHIQFGPQLADVSTGRLFDAKVGVWVTFPAPSPRSLNAPSACGKRLYSALDPTSHPMGLDLDAPPKIGATVNLKFTGAAPNGPILNILAFGAAYQKLDTRLTALVGLPVALLALPADANGNATLPLPIPDIAGLIGGKIYFQGIGLDAQGLFGSNALEITICPK